MSKKLLTRDEILESEKWKLEDIYESDELWEADLEKADKLLDKPDEYEGKLAESADMLLESIKSVEKLEAFIDNIGSYANMRLHENMADTKYQSYVDKIRNLYVKFASRMSYWEPELLAIDSDRLKSFMESDNGIKMYEQYINNIIRKKEHCLSAELEDVLTKVSRVGGAGNDIFQNFNNVDVKLGSIKDEDGNDVDISHGRYISFLQSEDRRVRKDAFTKYHQSFMDYKNTLAATYSANVQKDIFYANMRKYDSCVAASLSNTNIPVQVYDNLVKTVNDNLHLMHRYVSLRKRAMGLDEVHMYDIYASMVKDYDMNVPFEEAKEIVKEGLKPLGEDYIKILEEGFSSRWIDVRENVGKRSGAYSSGTRTTHPYVLLNYNDSLKNVFTLAHEMGHAIHSYKTNKKQPFIYRGYTLFVAEVASTCNESLLIRHLIANSKNKTEKMYLINYFLDCFKGTVFRQTMFAEFERKAHEMAEKGESLNAETLCSMYHDLNVKYFGKDMVVDHEIDIEWARVPHFYRSFYVYQYATGFSAAIAISENILKNGEKAVNDYFSFLEGGSSDYSIELLKRAGVDMSDKKPIEDAMKVFEGLLDEFESLLG